LSAGGTLHQSNTMSVARVKSLAGEAHFFEETINIAQVKKLLDNKIGPKGVPGKIEGMKWLLAQISKGRDVSQFFSSVVKIVITKSVELKKMVYMFLVNYVDANKSCRELALLAINSFQKDLADNNQLIRALSLRVLTSFRVPEICQIQLMAVKKCASDRSPYVRKTSAHSIPKLYTMDKGSKEELILVIEKLFEDRETMVIGSAVAAYSEVCPERFDLFHVHFRKLCHLLADVDEWGQIVIMEQLLRYARTQFLEPPERQESGGRMSSDGGGVFDYSGGATAAFEKPVTLGQFYEDDEDDKKSGKAPTKTEVDEEEKDEEEDEEEEKPVPYEMDKDHKLLLRSALPLLKSRNAGVTLAVASLYFYLGSGSPTVCSKIGRALVREMRNHREISYVILLNIAQMSERWPNMFRSELKEFYVNATDPSFIRSVKLKVMGLLANTSNVTLILRELQTYCRHPSKAFVVATVHTVGVVAKKIPSVSEQCLRGLMALVKSNSESVVAAAVIVIRRLLQQNPTENAKAVKRLVRLLEKISVPAARASIVWIVGEFSATVKEYAPDTLRKLAKGFRDEAVEVKFQILNLAVKLWVQTRLKSSSGGDRSDVLRLLFEYVLQLAKFDMNFDLRDRARLLSGLLLSQDDEDEDLRDQVVQMLGGKATMPIPDAEKGEQDATHVLGSLSAVVGHPVEGYVSLPPWTLERGDPSVRNAEGDSSPRDKKKKKNKKSNRDDSDDSSSDKSGFYSSEDDDGSTDSGSGSGTESGSDSRSETGSDEEGSGSEEESGSESESGSEEESHSEEDESQSGTSGGEDSSNEDGSDEEDSEPEEQKPKKKTNSRRSARTAAQAPAPAPAPASSGGDLFDLFDSPAPPAPPQSQHNSSASMADASDDPLADFMGLSLGGGSSGGGGDDLMGGSLFGGSGDAESFDLGPGELLRHMLLPAAKGHGLEVVAMFLRAVSSSGERVNDLELIFTNRTATGQSIGSIKLKAKKPLPPGVTVKGAPDLRQKLRPGETAKAKMHIDFNGKTEGIKFTLHTDRGRFPIVLKAPLGELLKPTPMSDEVFKQKQQQMGGMQEANCKVKVSTDPTSFQGLPKRVLRSANVAITIGSTSWTQSGVCRFVGRRVGSSASILFSVEVSPSTGSGLVRVNCESAMLSTTFLRTLRKAVLKDS